MWENMSTMIRITICISIIIILTIYYVNKRGYRYDKVTTIECGYEIWENRPKQYLKYYIIGIMFLLFDLEAVLIYPIITTIRKTWENTINNTWYYYTTLGVIYLVTLGLIYEIRQLEGKKERW